MIIHNRRATDESQKKQAADLSATLADVMLKHLTVITNSKNMILVYCYLAHLFGIR